MKQTGIRNKVHSLKKYSNMTKVNNPLRSQYRDIIIIIIIIIIINCNWAYVRWQCYKNWTYIQKNGLT
jgi:hypothetical protein